MINEIFSDDKLPSDIVNPFKAECIDSIIIMYNHYCFSNKPYFTASSVKFRNGNTRGEQSFDGKDLVDVFIKVRNFCKEL